MTNFALYVTLPPFIFINIIKSSNNVIFEWDFIVRFEIITLFILFLSFIISKYIIKNDTKKSSIFALNSSYPNYGYMGIPLCILAFGQTASIPISVILLIDSIVLLSFTSLLNTESTQKNYINKFFLLFLSMLKNPILMSKMGKEGRNLAEKKFSINDVIKTHLDIYKNFKRLFIYSL